MSHELFIYWIMILIILSLGQIRLPVFELEGSLGLVIVDIFIYEGFLLFACLQIPAKANKLQCFCFG